MLEGIRKSGSLARRLAITAAAGAVAVGTVAALTTSAQAAPVRTLWLSGHAIPSAVRSVHVVGSFCDSGSLCHTSVVKCVDVTPGQDKDTGVTFGGDSDTARNHVYFTAYSQPGCPDDNAFSLFVTDRVGMPEELPTERWWIELSQI